MRRYCTLFLLLVPCILFCQQEEVPRVSFLLDNGLRYHRMFRVEGPGIAYGFSMSKRESVPCVWPIGAKLYYSSDGEDTTGLIFEVRALDEGRTLSTAGRPAEKNGPPTVTVRLRNPGLFPRRVSLISYAPQQRGNGTSVFLLWSLSSKSFDFPVGTKLYLADTKQVDRVMSGQRIDDGAPFLVVTDALDGKSVNLR